jgi:hypothetical protein
VIHFGVATPLLWENVIRLMVWLLQFYGKMWFDLWCGYSTFMGKCDLTYGVATPLFPPPHLSQFRLGDHMWVQ